MISDQEFIDKTIGKPWVDRATGPDAYDCYGIVIKYFEEVRGVSLPTVKGYKNQETGIEQGYDDSSLMDEWRQCQFKDGAVFMVFTADVPVHCGVVTKGRLLHSMGSSLDPSQVCHHPLRYLERIYDRIEFWEYVG